MNSPQIDEAAFEIAAKEIAGVTHNPLYWAKKCIAAYLSAAKTTQSDNDYCEAGCFNPACSCNIKEKPNAPEE